MDLAIKLIVFLPLVAAAIAGLFCRVIGDRPAQIVTCARVLTSFVYDVIERSRRRSLREMWLAAREGDGEVLRQRILDYLSEGDAAPEVERLLDRATFRFTDWCEAVISDPDAGEWRGVTARLLASEPDHPGLLLARAVTELVLTNGDLREFESNLLASIRSSTARYGVTPDQLHDVARWLVDRTRNRLAALPAVYHAFAANGHAEAAAQVRSTAPDPAPAGLQILELADRLDRTSRAARALADHLAARSLT